MAFFHGAKAREESSSVPSPVVATSGISIVIGTAPVHTVGGKVNEVILAHNFNEAKAALGYSEDFEKYSLCEAMFTHFKKYEVGPVFFINVLDPATHKEAVASAEKDVTGGKIELPFEAIKTSVVVKPSGGTGTAYVVGTDYELMYTEDKLVLEVTATGAAKDATKLSIAYDAVKSSSVTATEIIGGVNATTKKKTGLELVDQAFPKYGIAPDIIIAPGFSHLSGVPAVMDAKADNINGVFKGKAIIDTDLSSVTNYSEASSWKTINKITSKNQILTYPNCKCDGKITHMSSHMAALMCKVDNSNGDCPCESPSNKALNISALVDGSGNEMYLDIQDANSLNSAGVVTALNFIGGFKLWGNFTACYPVDKEPKNYFTPISRMFGWVANTVILSFWEKIDNKLNRRLIDSIVNDLNIWLNGLQSEEKILGGKIEFREEDNTTEQLVAGKAVFHISLATPSPAQTVEFVLEYDITAAAKALAV